MKQLYIIANWKEHMTSSQATNWLAVMEKSALDLKNNGIKTIIVCPPFTLLPLLYAYVRKHTLALQIGSQNVSQFPQGAYTGEIAADMVAEFATYVIVGHSERRMMGESDEILQEKVKRVVEQNLTPIFCIQNNQTLVPEGVTIVAYEPPTAIGSGHPDTPESAQNIAVEIKRKYPFIQYVLYGGSVEAGNVSSFTQQEDINGVLVGGASLDPSTFSSIIINAQ